MKHQESAIMIKIFLVIASSGMVSSESVPIINANMPECELKGVSLRCDFQNSNVKELELRDILADEVSRKFTTITIQNAPIVRITRNICVDLQLVNVPKVRYLALSGCPGKAYAITATNTYIDRLPRKISRLTLTDSEVNLVRCDLGIQRIFATRSRLGEVDIPWPIGGSAFLRLDSTTIEKLVRLTIQEKVTLLMKNAFVDKISEEAIRVGAGCTLMLHNCTFPSTPNKAVILKSGAKLNIQDVIGKLNIVSTVPGKEDIDGKRAPGVPPKQPLAPEDERVDPSEFASNDCEVASPLIWVLPTLLATVEGLIIILLYNKGKTLHLFKAAASKDSETGFGGFDVQINDRHGQSAVPSFYQQSSGTDLHRLRKR